MNIFHLFCEFLVISPLLYDVLSSVPLIHIPKFDNNKLKT
jgi:hypothetical protein